MDKYEGRYVDDCLKDDSHIGMCLLWGIAFYVHSDPIVLGGNITSDTELVADQAYDVSSDIIVDPGVRLTISEGATLSFVANTKLQVNGELVIVGVEGNLVTLTNAKASPVPGDWDGIVVASGGVANIDYANTLYADNGVYYQSVSSGTLTNSHFSGCPFLSSLLRLRTYGRWFESAIRPGDWALTDVGAWCYHNKLL